MGFSLSGLSSITRDRTYDISFNDNPDQFTYNGQRLIPGPDGYYPTEKESFIRIEFKNSNASNSRIEITGMKLQLIKSEGLGNHILIH